MKVGEEGRGLMGGKGECIRIAGEVLEKFGYASRLLERRQDRGRGKITG